MSPRGGSTEAITDNLGDHVLVESLAIAVTAGPDKGKHVQSGASRIGIGTHESNQLVLGDPTVSAFHCEIVRSSNGLHVRDLGSLNGTSIDGIPVLHAPLRAKIVLAVGRSKLRITSADEPVRMPLSPTARFGAAVGRSESMRGLFAMLERAAGTDATILLEGETGTGKEILAGSIHARSNRADGPFVIVDCSTLAPSLVESQLFGHERGAFTGATETRVGAFEEASGGTVFLDEVGELDPELQVKLLRAIDKREIRRVGAQRPIHVDVRIVAATRRNLRQAVNTHRFRADLFYRLAVVVLRVPPLRERLEDLPLLVPSLLEAMGVDIERDGAQLVDDAFLAGLTRHDWPGNVRELRNHLEVCLALSRQESPTTPPAAETAAIEVDVERPLKPARELWNRRFERAYAEALLRRHGDNVAAAARAAQVERSYLHRLLRRHGLR